MSSSDAHDVIVLGSAPWRSRGRAREPLEGGVAMSATYDVDGGQHVVG
jgi:hypothetical protein